MDIIDVENYRKDQKSIIRKKNIIASIICIIILSVISIFLIEILQYLLLTHMRLKIF